MRALAIIFVISFFFGSRPLWANENQARLIEKLEPGVVKIKVLHQGLETSHGTGFFISEDGKLLTNFHVLKPLFGGTMTVSIETQDGKKFNDFELIKCRDDRNIDLCLLRLPYRPKAFFRPASAKAKKGTDILVLGHPRDYDFIVSSGIVSGFFSEKVNDWKPQSGNEKPSSAQKTIEYTQITAPISPGNSGGPVFDQTGQLVGISTWIRVDQGSQNLNFAISSDEISSFVKGTSTGQSFKVYRKKTYDETVQRFKELEKRTLGAMIKALDDGTDVNRFEIKTDPVEIKMADRRFRFLIPKIFDRCIQPENKSGAIKSLLCFEKGLGAEFKLEFWKTPGLVIEEVTVDLKSKPKPLPIVSHYQKTGEWTQLEKKLTPGQKKYLYSIPNDFKCKSSIKSRRPFWNESKECTAMTYNDGGPDFSTFQYVVQKKGDPFIVTATVSVSSSMFVNFFYQVPVFVVGSLESFKD